MPKKSCCKDEECTCTCEYVNGQCVCTCKCCGKECTCVCECKKPGLFARLFKKGK